MIETRVSNKVFRTKSRWAVVFDSWSCLGSRILCSLMKVSNLTNGLTTFYSANPTSLVFCMTCVSLNEKESSASCSESLSLTGELYWALARLSGLNT